jgi:hypothetical protein
MICPSCGTEFGYDDFAVAHDVLREHWIAAGMPWFSQAAAPPAGWDPIKQLRRIPISTANSVSTSASLVSFGNPASIPVMASLQQQEPEADVQYFELAVA